MENGEKWRSRGKRKKKVWMSNDRKGIVGNGKNRQKTGSSSNKFF